jgi:hypothetical protein
MVASAHDLHEPQMISRCVEVLDAEPTVALAYPRVLMVGPNGERLRDVTDAIDTHGLPPVRRYIRLLENMLWCTGIYGVMRGDTVDAIGPFRVAWGPDVLYLEELALRGEFAEVPEHLFQMRIADVGWLEDIDGWHQRLLESIDPSRYPERMRLGRPDLYRELLIASLGVVARSDLPLSDRLLAAAKTVRCFDVRFNARTPLAAARRMKHATYTRARQLLGAPRR